jgi:glycerol uptake facilitator-like aquaporin
MLKFPEVQFRQAMRDRTIIKSVGAEFLGVFFFQLLGALVAGQAFETAALFAALVFAFKFQSGGHLNPAVSMAAAASGHIDWTRGILYVIAQVLGALLGAFTEPAFIKSARLGHISPGCVDLPVEVSRADLFLWESIMTFFFLTVLYAAQFTTPGHGDAAPVATGLALFGALATGGRFTGYSPLNPARSLASTLTFECGWSTVWVYLLAQLTGLLLASLWAIGVYGRGPHYTGTATTEQRRLRQGLLDEEPASVAGVTPTTLA